jgi:acetyltransferase-like isoleucine patch superfamily enzyme
MKKFLRSLVFRIVNKALNVYEFTILLNKKKLVSGSNYTFYKTTTVINLANDASKIIIGTNSHIRGNLLIFAYGGQIIIGENCFIGENSNIWSGEKIKIGNNVLISHNVNIIDSNSHEIDANKRAEGFLNIIKQGQPKVKGAIITAPTIIKDFAWISFNSIILKGVTIGEGAIVGAGSVVTTDVPDFTMVTGNPAKITNFQIHR